MSNWATNQKKTSQKNPQNPQNPFTNLQGLHGHELCPVTSLTKTEHWKIRGREVDGWTCIYSQPRKSIRKPLKAPIIWCWKLSPQRWIQVGRPRVRRPSISQIDFSSIFRERPQTTTAIQKVAQPCDLLCRVLIEAGDVFFPTYKYIWIPTEYYLLRAHLSTTKNCLQCLGISGLSSSTNQKTHILPQSSKSSHWTVTCLAWNGSRHFFPYQKMGFFEVPKAPQNTRHFGYREAAPGRPGTVPVEGGFQVGKKSPGYKNQGFSQHHPLNAGWLGMGFLVAWINSRWRKKTLNDSCLSENVLV